MQLENDSSAPETPLPEEVSGALSMLDPTPTPRRPSRAGFTVSVLLLLAGLAATGAIWRYRPDFFAGRSSTWARPAQPQTPQLPEPPVNAEPRPLPDQDPPHGDLYIPVERGGQQEDLPPAPNKETAGGSRSDRSGATH